MKTDIQKCLEILKRVDDKGVHSFLLNQELGTTRSAARINDLKNLGYSIISKKEKLGNSWGCRYFLSSPIENKPKYIFDAERQVYYYG